jgi:hypothetical protein
MVYNDEDQEEQEEPLEIEKYEPVASRSGRQPKKPRLGEPTATASRPSRVVREPEDIDRPPTGAQQNFPEIVPPSPNVAENEQDKTGIKTVSEYMQ